MTPPAWADCPVCQGCGCYNDGHGFGSMHDENGPCKPCPTCTAHRVAVQIARAEAFREAAEVFRKKGDTGYGLSYLAVNVLEDMAKAATVEQGRDGT